MADQDIPERISFEEVNFARETRRLREMRGWSQSDLSQRLVERGLNYMNQATVSRIEAVTRPVRMIESLMISTEFGVDLGVMLRPNETQAAISNLGAHLVDVQQRLEELKNAVVRTAMDQKSIEGTLMRAENSFDEYPELPPAPDRSKWMSVMAEARSFSRMSIPAYVAETVSRIVFH